MTKVRNVSVVAVAALSAMLGHAGSVGAEEAPPTIVTFGDSYINGHGIAVADGFAARLNSALNAGGHPVTIVEMGYMATSKAGLSWLAKSKAGLDLQANLANHAVIVELGQNDCPFIKLDQTRANLDQLLSIFDDKRVPVLVVGTAAYGYCGADYAEPYSKMFSELATKHGDLLYADFKEGVTGHPELLQFDGDHPNAAGEAIVIENMLPAVEALLAKVQLH